MKTADFINLFKTGRLGKKRQHSGYKVMDGEHCQLLVRSTRRWGVPGGSELIGIYFGNGVCIFHGNFNNIRDSVTDRVTDPKPVMSGEVLKEHDEYLINSGIIEFDDANTLMLVEIGDTPWLFEHDPGYVPNMYANWEWVYNTGSQVSRRVDTIAEAMSDVTLPEGTRSAIGYLLKVFPSDYEPAATSEEDKVLLMDPPNPFKYGLTLDDLVTRSVYSHSGVGCTPLYVKQGVASKANGTLFRAAVVAFNEAAKRFDDRSPNSFENIMIDTGGLILKGANGQVYLKGSIHARYKSSETATFSTWHQILGKTTKLRLPLRC